MDKLKMMSAALLGATAAVLTGYLITQVVESPHDRIADLERAREADRLRIEGFEVSGLASQRELMRVMDRAATLADQVRRLKRDAGRVQVREVVRWQTREVEVPVPGVPVECEECGAAVACPEVAVAVSGTEARVETRRGNWLALGEVTVERTQPPPREVVATVPWQADLTRYMRAPEPHAARWMAGPAVGVSGDGALVGGMVLAPERALWRAKIRPAGLLLAGQGQGVVGVGITVGW